MPDITYTLDDGWGTPGKKITLGWQPVSPGPDGKLIVSTAPKRIASTVGVPTTVEDIAATTWKISQLGPINNNQPVYIEIDDAGGDVTELIKAAIGIPQTAPVRTLQDAAQSAVNAVGNPTVAGWLQTGASKEVLDGTYAPAAPTTAITYNPDGSVATVTENSITTTYTYNPDGTVATDTRLGVTRTYTYDGSGNLTGIAS